MTYSIMKYGSWHTPYWKEEVSNKKHTYKEFEEYSELDETLFKEVLKEILDVPNYKPTEENVKKEFSRWNNTAEAMPDECIKQIAGYYKWRLDTYNKIINFASRKAQRAMDTAGCDTLSLQYDIPAECNNYSCEEPHYTGGQTMAYLEIRFSKNPQ